MPSKWNGLSKSDLTKESDRTECSLVPRRLVRFASRLVATFRHLSPDWPLASTEPSAIVPPWEGSGRSRGKQYAMRHRAMDRATVPTRDEQRRRKFHG
jgi:hypothetical protein